MAIQNNPNMYTGGAVVLNSQPEVNIYAQHLQRKQAREEALDAYEMNRINRMNEQGVRDIDRPGLDTKVIDLKTYYQANKDKIRKGGSPEAYNYEKMFRDTLGGVSKSKNATARAETFNKIRLERQKVGRSTPEDWFQEYSQHEDTPIWDEKFTDLDLPKYMSQGAPKFDAQKTLKGFADIKRTPGQPRYEAIPGDRYGRNKVVDETFDTNAKTTIAARAHDLYDTDDGFAFEVQQDFNNPVKRGELEKISAKEFGTAPQSMADYAAAKIISQLQPTVSGKPKYEPLFDERQKLLQGYKQQNIATYQWYKRQDRAEQDYFIDAIIEDQMQTAGRNDGFFNPSPLVKEKFPSRNAFGERITPSKFKVADNGTAIEYSGNGVVPGKIGINEYKAILRDEFTAKGTSDQLHKSSQKPKTTVKKGELD